MYIVARGHVTLTVMQMKNKEKQFRAGDVSEWCRVVRLIGRKQISVRIILHNSEFLLPGHVVSGRLSGWAGELFKPNKLSQSQA